VGRAPFAYAPAVLGRPWIALALGVALLGGMRPAPVRAAEDSSPESPARLLERAFANLYADDFVQVMSLSTRRRSSRPMVRRVQLVRKQRQRPGKAMVRFLEPAEVRRTSVLILEAEGRYDDLFVFLPALDRVRRVSAGQRADSFFGTDLSYEDVEPKDASDWSVTLIGPGEEGGTPCLELDIRPRDPEATTYDRMVSCIEPERAVILRTDFWRNGMAAKQLRVSLSDVREVDGRAIPWVLHMETPRLRSETVVTTESYEIRKSLPDAIFTTSNLETGDADGDRRAAGGS
jgi:Outer membrane lipoprotein-sorting protein